MTAYPREDPTYVPLHPPDVVAKWGPRSQIRCIALRTDRD